MGTAISEVMSRTSCKLFGHLFIIMKIILIFTVVSLSMASAYPHAQAPGPGGLAYPKAGPNGHYDAKHYFQYTNVAAPDVFEWGYRRGNDPQHFREESLSQKAHNFKAKVRWGDAYEGQGEQFYDYNHSGPKIARIRLMSKSQKYFNDFWKNLN